MPGGANFLLRRQKTETWTQNISAQVGFSLLLLVFLALPAFFLIVQKTHLIVYYLGYPILSSLGLYLISRGKRELGSVIIILSVYGVVAWLSWLIGFSDLNPLKWWIVALLPWVMLSGRNYLVLGIMTAMPVVFSLALPHLTTIPTQLLPAEQSFIRQILRISVALGAFSCVYFLRKYYLESAKLRTLENEFYSHALDAIPLPIIIKDGITLDFVFFNQAARLTYDLNPHQTNSNLTTFSESSAAAVSRLDLEVLRSVTYHIEPDENFVHTTGLHWHFRTYRVPLELESSGRKLLISVSEDLRAWNLITRKAEMNSEQLANIYKHLSPLLYRYDVRGERLQFVEPPQNLERETWLALKGDVSDYLQFYLARDASRDGAVLAHRFTHKNRQFQMYGGSSANTGTITGLVIPLPD